ncbi:MULTISPECIES: FecCD family ABC transporter permease [Halorussus]|uniref:FecCD family ABC transporter permease n=1 Tax=Halorussus TaxID=1070314 RepID=UPI00209E8275|nr:iron ABC transporter permease [Halorussus vallis]USZ78090.1 iron ABC transporter permease [Halorussus vallis]
MSEETATAARREGRLGWLDGSLVTVALASVAITVVAGLVQVSFGTYTMSLATAWHAVFDPQVVFDPQAWRAFLFGAEVPEMSRESLVVWTIRLPRVFVAAFVGANLAVSGAIFQAVTRNELASPYVLGVSSGAGLAILLALVVFTGLTSYIPLLAALGGTAAFLLVYAIAWQGGTSPVRLVLAGVIVSTVFNSLQTGVFYFAEDLGAVQSAIAWTTGSLTGVDWEQVRVVAPWTALTIPIALFSSRQLNVLLLGERTAQSLGMSVEYVRFGVSAVAIVLAAASVAVAGLVGFVGLVVPHMVRTVVGSDYRRVLVGCVFAGPALVVLADVGARLALSTQIPVGIVTGVIGGPYFLYLMRKKGAVGNL